MLVLAIKRHCSFDALTQVHFGRPSCRSLNTRDVGNVIAGLHEISISGPWNLLDFRARYAFRNTHNHFSKGRANTGSEVINLPSRILRERHGHETLYCILDENIISDLFSVAVYG